MSKGLVETDDASFVAIETPGLAASSSRPWLRSSLRRQRDGIGRASGLGDSRDLFLAIFPDDVRCERSAVDSATGAELNLDGGGQITCILFPTKQGMQVDRFLESPARNPEAHEMKSSTGGDGVGSTCGKWDSKPDHRRC